MDPAELFRWSQPGGYELGSVRPERTGTPMADTWVDGCGVIADQPIGDGVRVRFRLDADPLHDVTARVADGRLHVAGMNGPLTIEPVEPHRIAVTARASHADRDQE